MNEYYRQIKLGAARGIGFGAAFLLLLSFGILVAQQITTFQKDQVVSAADMNTNFGNIKTSITTLAAETALKPPVGSIIAWHKSFTGVPSLPAGWMECNGATVVDVGSPLNGQVLPDLNGQARFLRGSGTSGTLQNATRVLSIAEIGNANEIHIGRITPGTAAFPMDVDEWVDDGTSGRASVGTSTVATNQRPDSYRVRSKNMSVVWIMRVK